ncbi:MAG: rhomboid family intramembrane serine protease [Capsulimonadaceae bacterium]|nr:rhomboid family intramembrane serine protease [Capsulimonadaceae bacterium]
MLLPYRSKNPPEHKPYVTIGLIVVNCLVYAITVPHFEIIFGSIRQGVVADWALRRDQMDPVHLITSMFLHENFLHIAGNMLFLWIFGTAAEGRLRPLKFLTLYLGTGMIGGIIQSLTFSGYSLGASGAIMGVAGAYVHMFPHAAIRVFWTFVYRWGISDWPAWGVVTYFIFFDVLNGLILRVHDGVAHLIHISAFIAGFVLAMVMRARRDTMAMSGVQATRADLRNELELMSFAELDVLMDAPTDNMDLVLVYCNKAIAKGDGRGEKRAIDTIEQYKDELLDYPSPEEVAKVLLKIPRDDGGVSGPFYLKLGSKLEGLGKFDTAAYVYRRIFDIDPSTKDSAAAIMRFARIWETIYDNKEMARDAYEVYLKLFPKGVMAEEAEKGLERLGGERVAMPIIRQTTIKRTVIDDEQQAALPRITAFDEGEDDTLEIEEDAPAKNEPTRGQPPKEEKFTVPNPFAGE